MQNWGIYNFSTNRWTYWSLNLFNYIVDMFKSIVISTPDSITAFTTSTEEGNSFFYELKTLYLPLQTYSKIFIPIIHCYHTYNTLFSNDLLDIFRKLGLKQFRHEIKQRLIDNADDM